MIAKSLNLMLIYYIRIGVRGSIMKPSKRNILWVIPLIIIGIFFWFYGPKEDITDNEYITYVKNHTLTDSNEQKIEQTLNSSCKNPSWVYFESQYGQDVVEFKGNCTVGNQKGNVNMQFLVDDDRTKLTVGATLLNAKQLSDSKKKQFIDSLLSS